MGGWTAGDQFQSLAGFLARCDVLPFPWSQSCHITFQSLAGFLARCDQTTRQVAKRIKAVSIPGGFSGSLRPVAKKRTLPSRLCFNPWRVFWLVATQCLSAHGQSSQQFQSLAGFLARCDIAGYGWCRPGRDRFNPWRVFWLVATQFFGGCTVKQENSFNPWRVFWLVATCRGRADPCAGGLVSIPGGFSGSLRLAISATKDLTLWQFQSLAGFLARCDLRLSRRKAVTHRVVSIPGGFSGSLRHPGCDPCHPHRSGFNPWRIFWLVATGDILRGRLQDIIVSIPGGFSGSLRLDDPGNQISHRFGFNPWRVFWLVATHRSG